ncbi:MAG: AbrB/MazE/SpoVT family DNA-binding domain-containing protein [Candidatus Saccharimonadales bacterium]
MNTSTVSSKYQIVIPKELRQKLQIKPGQKVSFELDRNRNLKISATDPVQELKGKYAGKWGSDPVAYIRKQRDKWDD